MASGGMRVRIRGLDLATLQALQAGDWTLVGHGQPCDLELVAAPGHRDGADDGHRDDHGDGATPVPEEAASAGHATARTAHLTRRETEVLAWLGRGASNNAIGHHLFITENTVKNHVRAILRKLDCNSRTEAVVTAHHVGLLEL